MEYSVIPASVRQDGSIRKELRIRPGYVPLEQMKTYQAPHRRREQQANQPVNQNHKNNEFLNMKGHMNGYSQNHNYFQDNSITNSKQGQSKHQHSHSQSDSYQDENNSNATPKKYQSLQQQQKQKNHSKEKETPVNGSHRQIILQGKQQNTQHQGDKHQQSDTNNEGNNSKKYRKKEAQQSNDVQSDDRWKQFEDERKERDVDYDDDISKINLELELDFLEEQKEKESKRLNKKLKQIEKLEKLNRALNSEEQAKISAKEELLKKLADLSLN
ncbi:partner of y14 and mago [Stylonychia lemnae]|uniref:Partner of y14 and mago n=1 Tax=Stylonychia lemnae TaxID=5949 RepID=A0A077ZY33_STYLE|nr:partner of y14 and mago [Stylonychia lemnae]|eukprot:CDW73441.1 partner of y14 and mago [Stylonychia lemnae]